MDAHHVSCPVGGKRPLAQKILFNVLQEVVVMALAPLVKGALNLLKERVQSKGGPTIFQPYFDKMRNVIYSNSCYILYIDNYLNRGNMCYVKRSWSCSQSGRSVSQRVAKYSEKPVLIIK